MFQSVGKNKQNLIQNSRIVFFFFKNVHIPILLPICEEMQRQGGFDIAFAVFDLGNRSRPTMTPAEMQILEQYHLPIFEKPGEWNPDVTIIADNVTYLLENCGKIVNVGHGLLSKGQYFTNRETIDRENLEDLLCVPGEYHKERIEQSNRVFIPVVATGMPKLDRLFMPTTASRDELLRNAGLDPSKRVVLYAPTFNIALTSITFLWMRIAQLADENTYLLIKLHSSTQPFFIEHYRELSRENDNIHFIDDPDLTMYMQMADIMVSDVSSAFMEFIALDKPVVLFDNPNISTYKYYDPNDIEYSWRDVGVRASTMEEVIAGVQGSFEHPTEFSERRQQYARKLLADRTGNAAGNVVRCVCDLLNGSLSVENTRKDSTTLLLPVQYGEESAAIHTARTAIKEGGDNLHVALVDHSCDSELLRNSVSTNSRIQFIQSGELQRNSIQSQYIGFLLPKMDLGDRRAFRLINHLRRNPESHTVAPLLETELAQTSPQQDPFQYIPPDTRKSVEPGKLDKGFRESVIAQQLPYPITASSHFLLAHTKSESGFQLLRKAVENDRSAVAEVTLAFDVVAGEFHSPIPEITNVAQSVNSRVDSVLYNQGATQGRLRMAYHYEKKGNVSKAIEHAQKILDEDPSNREAAELLTRLRGNAR